MAKAIVDIKKRGRPKVDSTGVMVRLPTDLVKALDKYGGGRNRPSSIRVILRQWLIEHKLLRPE